MRLRKPANSSSPALVAIAAGQLPVLLFYLATTCQAAHQNSSIVVGEILAQSRAIHSSHVHLPSGSATEESMNVVHHLTEKTNGHDKSSSLSSSMLRSYIRTNSMRAYHLDLHSYRSDKLYAGDAMHVDSSSSKHQARCRRHLEHYANLLRQFHEADPMDEATPMEALRLADMYGRPPSGLLEGHQFWLGSHDRCLEHTVELAGPAATSSLEKQERETIKSQYCLGLAQFPSWNPRDTKTSIKVGLCLPETCTNMMLNKNNENHDLVERMMKYQFGSSAHFSKLKLRSIYCLPHETSEIRQYTLSAKLLIGLLSCFALMCTYATVYDYLNNKLESEKNQLVGRRQIESSSTSSLATHNQVSAATRNPNKRTVRQVLIEGFSLIRNIDKLLTFTQTNKPSKDINNVVVEQQQQHQSVSVSDEEDDQVKFDPDTFSTSITGLKCIGLLWIIAAHTFLVSPIPSNNLVDLDKITTTIMANIFLTAHLMVDTFFALSGLLASYLIFKSDISKVKGSQWIVMTIHRYWRLTPVYLLSYWFTKSLGHLLNSGPLWDFGTAEVSPRYQCEQESWAEAWLHLSDFKSPKEHCVPFAWFIANGIKFWLVTPFLLLAIHKSMKRGYQLTTMLIIANMALVAKLAFSSNVDMKSVIEFKPESAENMLNNMDQVYTRPYSRIGAYLIGLLAGHYFYRIETKQIEVKLSKNMKILMWTLFSVTTIVMIFVLKLANGLPLDDSAIPYIFGLSSALIRPLWALCTCWLIFALAHGQARWLATLLSGNIWKLLGKLSFCAYLGQGEVIAHLYLAQSHSNAFTYVDLVTRPIVAIVLTMFVSVVMLLFIEYPLIGVEELVLPAKRKHKTSNDVDSTERNGKQQGDIMPTDSDNQATTMEKLGGNNQNKLKMS